MSNSINKLNETANSIRDDVLDVCVKNGAGHIAPSLSCVDILVALYYDVLNYDFSNPLWEQRDRVILSKAHGCYAFYSILADKGVIEKEQWENFYTDKSSLLGCMEYRPQSGFEAGCGSLGHGLPMAVGMAFASKKQSIDNHFFCIVGDGEMQEGSMWEALQFAVKHSLDNLTIIVDANTLQAMDFIKKVLDKESHSIVRRFEGFGTEPIVCTGHDSKLLADILKKCKNSNKMMPNVLIAETIKGYGLKCMESVPKFHFRLPTQEEIEQGKSYE